MRLGELVTRLSSVPDLTLPVVFGGEALYDRYASLATSGSLLIPTHFSSYRGYYDRPALVPASWNPRNKRARWTDVEVLHRYAINTIGETFTGWKGGEYVMQESSPVYVAEEGDSTSIGILDIVQTESLLVLVTHSIEDYEFG